MEIGLFILFSYFLAVWVGGLPGPIRTANWIGDMVWKSAGNKPIDRLAMSEIIRLDRETQDAWEKWFEWETGEPYRTASTPERIVPEVLDEYDAYIQREMARIKDPMRWTVDDLEREARRLHHEYERARQESRGGSGIYQDINQVGHARLLSPIEVIEGVNWFPAKQG